MQNICIESLMWTIVSNTHLIKQMESFTSSMETPRNDLGDGRREWRKTTIVDSVMKLNYMANGMLCRIIGFGTEWMLLAAKTFMMVLSGGF